MDLEDDNQQQHLSKFQIKTYKKLYKICKTICQMMHDRGYDGSLLQLEEFEQLGFQGFYDQHIKAKEDYIRNGSELMYPLYFIKKYDQVDRKDDKILVIFRKPVDESENVRPMTIDDLETPYKKFMVSKLIIVFPGDPEKDRTLFNRKKDDKNNEQLKQNQTSYFPTIFYQQYIILSDIASLEMFNQDDLVFNITKHVLVPTHIPLSTDEKMALLKKYSISVNQLPKILQSDPVTKYFGLKRGQVFKIVRDSETAGKYITYRVVV